MIHVSVSQLEPDMVLAAPVRHPAVNSHVLLQAGYRIETATLAHLDRFAVKAVWIRHPGFEFLDEKLGDAIPQSRAELYKSVKRSFSGVADKTSGAFDLVEYRTIIGNTIMAMIANKNNAVWAQRLMDDDGELFSHCSNVAYLSLVIGMQLKEYIFAQRKYVKRPDGTDLTNLGIGAMLHDLGKLGLGPQWYDIHFFDKGGDGEEYRSHGVRGHEAVRGRIEATASQIVLHHHQRFDGKGFPDLKPLRKGQTPKPSSGHNIHVFSRVVAVANTVDALIGRCKRRNLPLVAALAEIQQPVFEGMFDRVVLNAALRVIPPFPIGSCVELSDRRQAVVTDLNELNPCQPKVRLFRPGHMGAGEPFEELDLSCSDAPAIARVADQEVNPQWFYKVPERPVHKSVAPEGDESNQRTFVCEESDVRMGGVC